MNPDLKALLAARIAVGIRLDVPTAEIAAVLFNMGRHVQCDEVNAEVVAGNVARETTDTP